jgi:hypothetical protein
MKPPLLVASLVGAWFGLTGCASQSRVVQLPPIGPAPAPTERVESGSDGRLRVFSGRERALEDVALAEWREEWRWNDYFGDNAFSYTPAHSDYSIYDSNGKLVEQVRNARNQEDPQPAVVMLPPGHYEVKAEAENDRGTYEVRVPVVIGSGQTTIVRLAGS